MNTLYISVNNRDSALRDLKGLDGVVAFEYCGRVFMSLSSLLKWVLLK